MRYLVTGAPTVAASKQLGGRVAKVAIGMDVRLDEFGNVHPWRAVVAFDGKFRQFFMRLPPDRRYVSPPTDGHGDLTELPRSAAEQTEAIADFLLARGETAVIVGAWPWRSPVIVGLRARGIQVEEIELTISGEGKSDVDRIGGEAGHEIAQLLDPAVRDTAFAWQALERGEVSVQ